MNGGLAVRANLLCVTWSSARGHVFLFDVATARAISTFAVPRGATGYSDAGGVAMDDRFHLFVADAVNDRVRHFSAFGKHLADLGHARAADETGPRDRLGHLSTPAAVAVIGDDVFVAGGERPLRRAVQRFSRDGRALGFLRSMGESEGEFASPRGLHADADGILVAETLAARVQRFQRNGRFVASIALEKGSRPTAVVRAADGRILVVDRRHQDGRILAFEPGGRSAAAGALTAAVEDAVSLARDEQGNVLVLDRGGERVLRFSPDLGFDVELVDLAAHLHAIHT